MLVSPAPGGAHNWYPMAFNPTTGLVYLPARQGSFALHAPDKGWISNTNNWNRGEDVSLPRAAPGQVDRAPPMTGLLIAWDPARAAAGVAGLSSPWSKAAESLATAGNLIFQGRSDGLLCAYRATDGKQLWQFDAGTGIMAPPVTYLLNGVQYVTVMVGWGGAAGLNNIPGSGVVKPGFGRILTFSLGAHATLEVPPFGHPGPPSPSIHMKATPAHDPRRRCPIQRGTASTATEWESSPAPAFLTCAMPPPQLTNNSSPSCWEALPTNGDALVQRCAQT